MDEEAQRRAARNELLFRETNEAIERRQWPDDPEKVVRFRCECAHPDCTEAVEMSLADYERVRACPRRFLVVASHVLPEIETVVGATDSYTVVEKREKAGEIADAADPRS